MYYKIMGSPKRPSGFFCTNFLANPIHQDITKSAYWRSMVGDSLNIRRMYIKKSSYITLKSLQIQVMSSLKLSILMKHITN